MTKLIKMSLIAAVAITGLATSASAQPIKEALDNVDFSGNLRYRYTNGESNPEDTNQYKLQMSVKSKLDNMVTATVSTDVIAATSDTTGDADPYSSFITEANFAFDISGNTIIAGKQALPTPFADGGASSDAQQGTGVVAVVPVNGVTIAGGLFLNSDAKSIYSDTLNKSATDNHNDVSGNNIAAIAAIGSFADVKYAAWYAVVSESKLALDKTNGVYSTLNVGQKAIADNAAAGAKALNLNFSAPVGPVNVEVNYAKVDYSANADGKTVLTLLGTKELSPTQTRVVVSGDVGTISLAAAYIKAGKDGGDVTLGDSDATANIVMEAFSGTSLTDTSAIYLSASAPVGPVTAKLEYGKTSDVNGADTAGSTKFSETKLSVSYEINKKLTASAWVTATSGDTLSGTDYGKQGANRIELNYTF